VRHIVTAFTKTFRLTFWLGAITGALVAVPIALSTATAHADSVNWDAIAQCESGGNWSTSTGNGHAGGLQFKQSTWNANGGVGSPANASRAEQIRVAENVLATQGIGAWPKCGTQGGSPTVWNVSSVSAPSGCQVVPGGAMFGVVDFQRMCSALLNPLAAFNPLR
jgi:hypothetical protein